MACLKIGIIFLATLCSIRGEVASRCDVSVEVAYPTGSEPSPTCSLICGDSSSGLAITGVAYQRFSVLQQNFELMVKISFKSGQLTSCTLVPYLPDDQLQAELTERRAAMDACSRIEPTLPTTAAPAPTTPEPTPILTTTPESTTLTTPEPTIILTTVPTSEPATTTPELTTTTPEPTTTTPEPTTTTPEPTTVPTTIPTTTTTTPKPTTTTTTTLAPITYSCPYGFTQFEDESCYRQFTFSTTWANAQSYCRIYGATLVRISSASEYKFVTKIADKKKFWTDANDLRSENKHVFSDYKTSAYLKWAKNEPTGNRWFGFVFRGEDCVSLDRKKGMYDDDCDDRMPFMCERATIPSR